MSIRNMAQIVKQAGLRDGIGALVCGKHKRHTSMVRKKLVMRGLTQYRWSNSPVQELLRDPRKV